MNWIDMPKPKRSTGELIKIQNSIRKTLGLPIIRKGRYPGIEIEIANTKKLLKEAQKGRY
jgi:hypothetical protein